MGSRTWAFAWYQNRWRWMTLNGVVALLRYFAELGSFRAVLRKSGWRYIDTFCEKNLVFSGITYGDICRESPPASSGGFWHVQQVRPNRGPTKGGPYKRSARGVAIFLHAVNNGRHPSERVKGKKRQWWPKKVASFYESWQLTDGRRMGD